ncbi:hypothetical protein AgCh_040056 [Apium graveolens]
MGVVEEHQFGQNCRGWEFGACGQYRCGRGEGGKGNAKYNALGEIVSVWSFHDNSHRILRILSGHECFMITDVNTTDNGRATSVERKRHLLLSIEDHLYKALLHTSIRPFMDDPELK